MRKTLFLAAAESRRNRGLTCPRESAITYKDILGERLGDKRKRKGLTP
jgi:hypothetical protein